jgi:hypothetical protein
MFLSRRPPCSRGRFVVDILACRRKTKKEEENEKQRGRGERGGEEERRRMDGWEER